jgi:cytochrome c oxidase subunit 3
MNLTQQNAPVINRPSQTAVGILFRLGSEVMFFAGLFAVYFSLRAQSGQLWPNSTWHLNVPFALVNALVLRGVIFHCAVWCFRCRAHAASGHRMVSGQSGRS